MSGPRAKNVILTQVVSASIWSGPSGIFQNKIKNIILQLKANDMRCYTVVLTFILVSSFSFCGTKRIHQLANKTSTEGYITTADNVRLFYKIEGAGNDTLIVLHGGPSLGLGYMAAELKPLTNDYTVIYYDQRGSGFSTPLTDSSNLSIDKHISDLEAIRKHFQLNRIVIAGHSWGGMLTSRYAISYSDRVSKMILIDPMTPSQKAYNSHKANPENAVLRRRADSIKRVRADSLFKSLGSSTDPLLTCRSLYNVVVEQFFYDSTLFKKSIDDFCWGTAETLRNRAIVGKYVLSSLGDWDVRPLLNSVKIPVLIIHGTASAVKTDAILGWLNAFPDARLLKVENAGHYVHADRPDIFFPAVKTFLSGKWPLGVESRSVR